MSEENWFPLQVVSDMYGRTKLLREDMIDFAVTSAHQVYMHGT